MKSIKEQVKEMHDTGTLIPRTKGVICPGCGKGSSQDLRDHLPADFLVYVPEFTGRWRCMPCIWNEQERTGVTIALKGRARASDYIPEFTVKSNYFNTLHDYLDLIKVGDYLRTDAGVRGKRVRAVVTGRLPKHRIVAAILLDGEIPISLKYDWIIDFQSPEDYAEQVAAELENERIVEKERVKLQEAVDNG